MVQMLQFTIHIGKLAEHGEVSDFMASTQEMKSYFLLVPLDIS